MADADTVRPPGPRPPFPQQYQNPPPPRLNFNPPPPGVRPLGPQPGQLPAPLSRAGSKANVLAGQPPMRFPGPPPPGGPGMPPGIPNQQMRPPPLGPQQQHQGPLGPQQQQQQLPLGPQQPPRPQGPPLNQPPLYGGPGAPTGPGGPPMVRMPGQHPVQAPNQQQQNLRPPPPSSRPQSGLKPQSGDKSRSGSVWDENARSRANSTWDENARSRANSTWDESAKSRSNSVWQQDDDEDVIIGRATTPRKMDSEEQGQTGEGPQRPRMQRLASRGNIQRVEEGQLSRAVSRPGSPSRKDDEDGGNKLMPEPGMISKQPSSTDMKKALAKRRQSRMIKGDNDSGVDESTQEKDRNGPESPGSPLKTPTKETPPEPEPPRPSSATPSQKSTKSRSASRQRLLLKTPDPEPVKKVPMNKISVGMAPSPNLKAVKSKIGSLNNTTYKPGGGNVKIESKRIEIKAAPKIEAKNEKYVPKGGDKKIVSTKLQWNAKSKIGSLENAHHKPGGGDKKIETLKPDFKDKAKPKVGSKDNLKHAPTGGDIKIQTHKLEFKAQSKIGSLDNVKYKPGGGDVKIFDDKEYLKNVEHPVPVQLSPTSQSPTPPVMTTSSSGADENLNEQQQS